MLYTQDSDNDKIIKQHTKEINKEKYYQYLDKYYIHIQLALGILIYILGGISWVVWESL